MADPAVGAEVEFRPDPSRSLLQWGMCLLFFVVFLSVIVAELGEESPRVVGLAIWGLLALFCAVWPFLYRRNARMWVRGDAFVWRNGFGRVHEVPMAEIAGARIGRVRGFSPRLYLGCRRDDYVVERAVPVQYFQRDQVNWLVQRLSP